jgi:hypothetical protein
MTKSSSASARDNVRRAIDAVLAHLEPEDRRLVLLELVALDFPDMATAALTELSPIDADELPFLGTNYRRVHRTDRLLRELMADPHLQTPELTKRVYGDDSRLSCKRLQNLLRALRKKGRIERGPHRGAWRVVE